MIGQPLTSSRSRRTLTRGARLLRALRLDGPLLVLLAATLAFGLLILYSASGGNMALWTRQAVRIGVAVTALLVLALVPARFLRILTPLAYGIGIVLLVVVAGLGDIGKGAQRWLDLGLVRFQPSELMKLAVPMMCAWYLHDRALPASLRETLVALVIILLPAALIAEQPDLGTALLVAAAGIMVLLLSGLPWRYVLIGVGLAAAAAPLAWFSLHDYQRQRLLMLLNPQSDPLGAGYHIIQSQIAIGSGGVFGKGWMNGSQAQLDFLPERSTDFIFAVIGEELGLLGQLLLLGLYLGIVGRALFLANECRDTFGRLVAGSVGLTFFVYVFVNTGMVTGLLPVVGVPLPLVSYGGTSMVTLLAGFGILMSIHTHRKLLPT
jgi:rod shape determining protein RodA